MISLSWQAAGVIVAIIGGLSTASFFVLSRVFVPRREVFHEFKEQGETVKTAKKDLRAEMDEKQDKDVALLQQSQTLNSITHIERDIKELKETAKKTAEATQSIAVTVGKIEATQNGK